MLGSCIRPLELFHHILQDPFTFTELQFQLRKMEAHLSLDVSDGYPSTPLSNREGALPLQRDSSTSPWSTQTPPAAQYYHPNTPASDKGYRSQYVVDWKPVSSSQSFGTVTPQMLRTIPETLPPSPFPTPDVMGGLTHSYAYQGFSFASGEADTIRCHPFMYYLSQIPKQATIPSLVIDDNGEASIGFSKPESHSRMYYQEAGLEDQEDDLMIHIYHPQLCPTSSPYGTTRSNIMSSSTPLHTPPNIPHLNDPYAPVSPVSFSQQIASQNSPSNVLSDPSLAASLALSPRSAKSTPHMFPPTPPSGRAPLLTQSRGRHTQSSFTIPLIVSVLDKPHVCEICQARFKRLEHLRRHHKTHTGERRFHCQVTGCGKWFSRSDNLIAHRRYSISHLYLILEPMVNLVVEISLFRKCLSFEAV